MVKGASEPGRLGGFSTAVTFLLPNRHNVAHTRVIMAHVGDDILSQTNWNRLMRHIHEIAYERLGSIEAVQGISNANIAKGYRKDSGYMPLPDCEYLIQGTDAKRGTADSVRSRSSAECLAPHRIRVA
jgi:hypothetical protein